MTTSTDRDNNDAETDKRIKTDIVCNSLCLLKKSWVIAADEALVKSLDQTKV